jgi:hypothetical protein
MTDPNEVKLEQAYDLIQQGRLEEAKEILQPILQADFPSADAWWLWANAVSEPEDAREALKKVLEYAPERDDARQLLARLDELYPPLPEAETSYFDFGETDEELDGLSDDFADRDLDAPPDLPEIPVTGGQPSSLGIRALEPESAGSSPAVDLGLWDDELEGEELPSFEGEPDFMDDLPDLSPEGQVTSTVAPTSRSRGRSILRSVLIVLLVLLLALAAVIVIRRIPSQPVSPAGQPTAIAAGTEVPLQPSSDVLTVLDAAESAANAQAELLGGASSAEYVTRNGAPAIVREVCRPAGADLTYALNIAMDITARFGLTVQNEVASVGAEFVNCERGDSLLGALAPIEQAVEFANGSLSRDQFRVTWQWTP